MRKRKRARERQGKATLAPAAICYFSSTWHWEQPSSGKECTSLAMRTTAKQGQSPSHRPDWQHLHVSHIIVYIGFSLQHITQCCVQEQIAILWFHSVVSKKRNNIPLEKLLQYHQRSGVTAATIHLKKRVSAQFALTVQIQHVHRVWRENCCSFYLCCSSWNTVIFQNQVNPNKLNVWFLWKFAVRVQRVKGTSAMVVWFHAYSATLPSLAFPGGEW